MLRTRENIDVFITPLDENIYGLSLERLIKRQYNVLKPASVAQLDARPTGD